MTIRDFALEGIETTLNHLLALDEQAPPKLARFHGRVIALELRGTHITLYFVPSATGTLQLLGSIEGEPDCTLSGSPLDLMRASDQESSPGQLFAGHVSIGGDTELAHSFSKILGGLDIDWEEQLSQLVGDIAAHEIGNLARKTISGGRQTADSLGKNLSEYLTEEARLVPHRFEADEYLQAVDRTRDDVDRLAARIALLEQRTENGDKA